MELQGWQFYAVIGFLCLTAEIVTPSFYLAPIGAAALLTIGLTFLVSSVTWQLVFMAIVALALYFTLTPFARARFNRAPPPAGVGISGQIGTLQAPCTSGGNSGKVLVYADTWDIFWDDADTAYVTMLQSLPVGARVRIKKVIGNKVIIEPVQQ
jgi:membrane protein implicated in regulation of membrane protease activity